MKRSLIVYGPKGCGKTVNAERLRFFYNLDRIVDEGKVVGWDDLIEATGVLYLCVTPPKPKKRNGAMIMTFSDAMYFSGAVR